MADKERALNPLLEELPKRIKFARDLWGWSQEKLATAAGVEQPSISRYERGQRLVSISADTLIRLASALGVSLIWLATGQGPIFGEGGPTLVMKEGDPVTVTSLPAPTRARNAKHG